MQRCRWSWCSRSRAAREEKPAEGAPPRGAEPAEPAGLPRNAKRDAYFGDLHVHTSFSIDSYIFGNRLGPRDAYRFARGEEVTLHGGATQKLRAPLDFAAVTDHAEGLEIMASASTTRRTRSTRRRSARASATAT